MLPTVGAPVDPALPVPEGVVVLPEQDVLRVGGVDGCRRFVLRYAAAEHSGLVLIRAFLIRSDIGGRGIRTTVGIGRRRDPHSPTELQDRGVLRVIDGLVPGWGESVDEDVRPRPGRRRVRRGYEGEHREDHERGYAELTHTFLLVGQREWAAPFP